jgi:glycosyltransferase involved in cell wall biosynthesis
VQVVHTHDVHGLMDATICRRLMPSLRHVHTFHFGNYPARDKSSARSERVCWRSPDALVAVGQAQADAISALYGIPRERLRVIWNGVDDPVAVVDCDLRARLNSGARPVILSVSTLIEQKGVGTLLEAAQILKSSGQDFRLVIAGHGHLRQTLEEQAAALGLSRQVEFLGWVPDASRRILSACDVFVQSSLWEAMSIVVLEAMAAARPMVVTRVGENAHAVIDGVSGLLVPPADPQALAAGLAKLISRPALAAAFGAAARDRYLKYFTVEPMVSAYERLYSELAEARSRTSAR